MEVKNKILIVEDDTTLRDNISDYLSKEGFSTDTAIDGVEAYEKIKKFLPDLVLCDIALPKLNGFELLQKIRSDEILNDIPFIFLTAMVGMDDFKTGMKLGAEDYITKPFDFEKLITTIKSRINKQIEYRISTEKKYRSLIENSLTGVFIFQSEKIIYTNPKFREILKFDAEDNIDFYKIIHPDYIPTIVNYIIDCLKGKISDFDLELKAIRKDGKEIFIQIYAGKSKYENKPAILGNVLDITLRKAAEEKIKKSEKRYRELLAMVPAGVVELDLEGKIQYTNCEFLHLTGYKLADVLRKNILELIPENSVYNEIKNFLDNIFKYENEPTPLYIEMMRKNGNIIAIEARWNYLKDLDGNITGLIASLIDITKREKSRKELIKSEERFHSLLKISSEFIWELDEKGIFNFVSEKVFDILPYTNDEMIGNAIYDYIIPAEKEKVKKHLNDIYVNNKPFVIFEATYINNNQQETILENKCIPIYDEKGNIKGIRGASRTVSEIIKLKEKNIILNEIINSFLSNRQNVIIFEDENSEIHFTESNKYFLGYPVSKFRENKNFITEIIHTEDRQKYLSSIEEWKTSEAKSLRQFYRIKSAEGKYNLIEDLRFKILVNNKHFLSVAILTTIKEKSNEEKDLIIEKIPLGIILTNSEGNIIFANPLVSELFEHPLEKLLNKNYKDIIFQKDNKYLHNIKETLELKGYYECELQINDLKKSKHNYKISITNIRNNENINTNLLITIQKEKEISQAFKEIDKLKERLERYIKLESKFISKFSHDVRSPINTIIGYIDILKEKFSDDRSNIIYDKILNSAYSITETLDKSLELLQLKTIEDNLKFEKIDLYNVINDNINSFKTILYDKKIMLDMCKKSNNLIVLGDKILINQLFYTLFTNIIEQTKDGGLSITIESSDSTKNRIAIIRITTTVTSFCRIFEECLKTNLDNKEINESSNIDKATLDFLIIKKILKIHNATINFECINNEYCIFTIVFPII